MRRFAVAFLLLSACSAESPQGAALEQASAPSALEAAPRAVRVGRPSPASAPRMIIRTASLALVVEDAAASLQRIVSLVESRGGYLAETRQWRENDQLRAEATLRVPESGLFQVLPEIRKGAIRVESESVTGQDVSEEFSDLEAQLINLRATEAELRELLAVVRQRMQKASDILEIHTELTKIRGQIERIEGRRKYLSQMTSLSTINVQLIPDALARPVVEPGWRPLAIVKNASRALVTSLKWIVEAVIWLLIYLLPLILALAVVMFLLGRGWRMLRRRSRGSGQSPQGPPG